MTKQRLGFSMILEAQKGSNKWAASGVSLLKEIEEAIQEKYQVRFILAQALRTLNKDHNGAL